MDYSVVTSYEIRDNASGKVSNMADQIGQKLAGAASAAASAFDSIVSKMAAVGAAGATLAAGAAVMGVKKGLADINANLEDTRIGFATLFNMFGVANGMDEGLAMSADLVAKIRNDAKELPGEMQDFVAVAQTITSPMLNAGKGIEDIRNMTRDTVVAAAALKMPFEQASREMAMLLEGRAGAHNILGTRLGITSTTQVNGKDFNQATESERVSFMVDKLAKAKESLPELARSWSGLTSTMVDGMKQLLGRATLPLFERIKSTVSGINDMLGTDKAFALADAVGRQLVAAYDWLVAKAGYLRDHWEGIRDSALKFGHELHAAFEKLWPVVEKIAGYLSSKLQDPGGFIRELATLRVGLGAAEHAPDMIGGIVNMGKALGGSGGAGAAASEAGVALAAGPALIALAAAAVAVGGVFDLLRVNTKSASGMLGALAEAADNLWRKLKINVSGAFDELSQTFADLLTTIRPIADLLGTGMLFVVNNLVDSFRMMLWPISQVAHGLGKLAKMLPGYGDVKLDTGPVASPDQMITRDDLEKERKAAELAGLADANATKLSLLAEQNAQRKELERRNGLLGKGALAGKGAVQVNVNAPISILASDDPERVAMRVATHLDTVLRNPKRATAYASLLQD